MSAITSIATKFCIARKWRDGPLPDCRTAAKPSSITSNGRCSAFASCAFYFALLPDDDSICLRQDYPLVSRCNFPGGSGRSRPDRPRPYEQRGGGDVGEIRVECLVSWN